VLVVSLLALLCGAPSSPAREVRPVRTVVLLYPEVRLLPEILAVEDAIRPALEMRPDSVGLYEIVQRD